MVDCFTVLVYWTAPSRRSTRPPSSTTGPISTPPSSAAEPGQPVVTLTLPADNLAHAVQTALALIKAAGYRPVRVDAMTAEEFDRR